MTASDDPKIKAQLVLKIEEIIRERDLTQAATAQLFAVRQPDVSKLLELIHIQGCY